MEFNGFDGDEDEQYSLWNKQLKKHERRVVTDEIDDLLAEEDYDPADDEDWN